ncbi:MAG: dihydropteroate synthase [Spirochaetaceae bacterium]|jgi:dihydropteroate synthase|nr:dihydropteroate synthase [Spirochaetaceae bacterium]
MTNKETERTERIFRCRERVLPLGKKTYIMGILNVTPDSFSDGGQFFTIERAVEQAHRMIEEGADIIDIGGESSRPGFAPVDEEEELRRVLPVVAALSSRLDAPLSIDTTKAAVARKALDAGAHIINDIWGFQKEPALPRIAAETGAGVILMHNSDTGVYGDIIADIRAFFTRSAAIALDAGVTADRIVLDPGIGFGKDTAQNLAVMRRLREFADLGFPLLTGTSRKSLVGNVLGLPAHDRLEGTAATVALSVAYGADFVRVHDVKAMKRVAAMTDAMTRFFPYAS